MTTTAIPSQDPIDFKLNVENTDRFVNSTDPTFTDRFGNPKKTITGALAEIEDSGVIGFATLALLNADLAHREGVVAYVTNDPAVENNTTYRKVGASGAGSWVASSASPVNALSDRVDGVEGRLNDIEPGMITRQPLLGGQEAVLVAAGDDEGGEVLLVTAQRLRTPAFEAEVGSGSGLVDGEGGILLYRGADRLSVGPLDVDHTMLDGVFVVDEEGAIFQELSATPALPEPGALDDGAYFAQKIVTAPGIPVRAHVASMLSRREDALAVVATIASASTAATASSSVALDLSPEVYGSAATLSLRDEGASLRQSMPLQLLQIPNPPPSATPIKILLIADSIGNYEGAKLLSEYLTVWGYAPSFIGTVNGSANDTSSNTGGPLGECRPGWETGDFTYSLTNEATPVAVGDEAAYLALSKTSKITRNPFIRLAIGGDAPEIVRNGYVLDFEFYRTRFGLSAPDVVIYAPGTNDARDRPADTIYGDVYANDMLLLARLRAAWPDAKILRTLPGTGVTAYRNELWASKYTKIIRAMRDAAVSLVDPLLTIVPTWAFTNPDGGYSMPAGVADATTGFTAGDFGDAIHPIGASRKMLYQSLSPYVAAAALDII